MSTDAPNGLPSAPDRRHDHQTQQAPPATTIPVPPSGAVDDKVHSTHIADMLQRLACAPRLDLARYAIEGEVARGGMGAILRILDRQLNRRLAMKVLLDRDEPQDELERQLAHQILGRFLEEAQVTSQLDHPGVVPVHELGLDQHGKVYFTMRLVKGRTARDVFAESYAGSTDWPLTRALEVILRVCDTISYAHDKGVLHRDLKPDNVMVGRFGEVYVMDWGLAKVLDEADRHDVRIRPETAAIDGRIDSARKRDADQDVDSSVVSMDGQKLGTPSYMPPEQARGEELDERADVYAIGAMLYQLLTGVAPYTSPGARKPAYRILEDVAAGPPTAIEDLQKGVPAELVAIVGTAMARTRDQRYATAAALAADLRAFLAMHAVQAYRTGALVELQLWIKRNKPLAASLLAAVLILAAGVVVASTLAEQNAVLAEQKTELAEAEGRAKAEAQRTVDRFHQLAVVVRHQDALAKQDTLWPAWPDRVPALEAWLDQDCDPLLAQRPRLAATIAALRQQALPPTPRQVAADRRAAPEWPTYERQRQLVASLERAQAIRTGATPLVVPDLPVELREADPGRCNAFAWPRIAPEDPTRQPQQRTSFGDEALALAAARTAVARSANTPELAPLLDTLAWAELANGQDDAARQRSAQALALAPATERATYEGHQQAIAEAIASAPARLDAARARLAELDAVVAARRTWVFGTDPASESAGFLHDALVGAMAQLDAMERRERNDVALRLSWARQVRAASLAHARARTTWAEARAAIAAADDVVASRRYAGARIPLADDDVLGLVPIGMNPVTKLWEFYDLRSAWNGRDPVAEIDVPAHRADGTIEVTDWTGIVFVLLPGGLATLGAQADDPNAPIQDPRHRSEELRREVWLAPFLLARHELTQGQWLRLWTWDESLRTPSYYQPGATVLGRTVGWTNPVEQVDYRMVDLLLRRHGMALPTDAQWEYGCRAGTNTPWCVPYESLRTTANLASSDAASSTSWVTEAWADGHVVHAPVGSYAPNAFGLHDVHGNVWEWTADAFGPCGDERSGDGARPEPEEATAARCSRGGSFQVPAVNARAALRSDAPPSIRSGDTGVRPARRLAD